MKDIYVTKTFLPPLEEFIPYLEKIWETGFVTNDGPMFKAFEEKLKAFTKHDHVVCMNNGTLTLQLAVRALNLTGEVITTPFTHVATSGSLFWENCIPVYCDIDPETLNIDSQKIESLITENTSAIMATHVYSNPCDIGNIAVIAKKYNLKVIYDAAHAFGVNYKGKSIMTYGDLSSVSFNATKAFHTVEGGALFCHSQEMEDQLRKLAYFGMDKNKKIVQKYGTNAKLIEFCAALGLLNFKYFLEALKRKKNRYQQYLSLLSVNPKIEFQKINENINYSYMPIILKSKEIKDEILKKLNKNHIYPREYFYPSIETIFSDSINCPIALDISNRVLCLPMSDYITEEEVSYICSKINKRI